MAAGVDIATLGLKVDAGGIDKATVSLSRLGAEGKKVEQQATRSAVVRKRNEDIYVRAARERLQMQRQIAAADRDEANALDAVHPKTIKAAQAMKRLADEQQRSVQQMGRWQSQALAMDAKMEGMGKGARKAGVGMGRLGESMVSVTRQATGMNPALAQAGFVLGGMGIGNVAMIGVLAGLAAMALALRGITKDAREAKEELEKQLDVLRDIAKERDTEARGGSTQVAIDAGLAEAKRLSVLLQQAIAFGNESLENTFRDQLAEQNRLNREAMAVRVEQEEELTEATARELEQRQRNLERAEAERIRFLQAAAAAANEASEQSFTFAGGQTEGLLIIQGVLDEVFGTLEELNKIEITMLTQQQLDKMEEGLGVVEELKMTTAELAREEARLARDRDRAAKKAIRDAKDWADALMSVAEAFGDIGDGAKEAVKAILDVAEGIARIQGGDVVGGSASVVSGVAGLLGELLGDDSGEKLRAELKEQGKATKALNDSIRALNRTMTGSPSELMQQFQTRKAQPRQSEADVRAAQSAALAAAIARVTQAFNDELDVRELIATGATEQAAALQFQFSQERELREAELAGWDEASMARLNAVQEEERLAFARDKAAAAAQRTSEAINDLTFRGLAATGDNAGAARFRMNVSQARERRELEGESSSVRLMQSLVHYAERLQLEISIQTQAITDAANEQIAAIDAQLQTQQDALATARDQLRTQEQTVAITSRVVDSLDNFSSGLLLSNLSPLSPSARLQEARAQFGSLSALALGGDVSAAESLPGAARALLDASEAFNASGTGFVKDFDLVQEMVNRVREQFAGQLTIEEQMLAELQSQSASLTAQIADLEKQRQAVVDAANAQIAAAQKRHGEQMEILKNQLEATNKINIGGDVDTSAEWVLIGKTWRKVKSHDGDPATTPTYEPITDKLVENIGRLDAANNLLTGGFAKQIELLGTISVGVNGIHTDATRRPRIDPNEWVFDDSDLVAALELQKTAIENAAIAQIAAAQKQSENTIEMLRKQLREAQAMVGGINGIYNDARRRPVIETQTFTFNSAGIISKLEDNITAVDASITALQAGFGEMATAQRANTVAVGDVSTQVRTGFENTNEENVGPAW